MHVRLRLAARGTGRRCATPLLLSILLLEFRVLHLDRPRRSVLYEEKTDDEEFETLCRDVASAVTMHSDFMDL